MNLNFEIMTIKEAMQYVWEKATQFNSVSCPKFLHEGKNEADTKLIIDAYYEYQYREFFW